jgi:hypothetical protein
LLKSFKRAILASNPPGICRMSVKMLKALAPGDVVTVTRIDRLARSTFDLFAIVNQIVDAKAQFRSLPEPWADNRHQHRALDDCRSRRLGRRGARPYPHPMGTICLNLTTRGRTQRMVPS